MNESRLGLLSPLRFAAGTALLVALQQWPRRWLLSGAPVLQFFILHGNSRGNRILPLTGLWSMFTTLHLIYAIVSTSWLLYGYQIIGDFVRKKSRFLLKQLHFIDDKVAFFHVPALEIDTEVDGLMVLRGITFSLSTLSFTVHGVEVGIKLSDDMELAIQTEKVTVALFRRIDIGDCFANVKGGQYEMTFGCLPGNTHDENGDAIFVEDTPLLRAASGRGNLRGRSITKMTKDLTNDNTPDNSSIGSGLKSMEKLPLNNEEAAERYRDVLQFIEETSSVQEARMHIHKLSRTSSRYTEKDRGGMDADAFRAAICSELHQKPSVPHPPRRSIKVTTVQNALPPPVRSLLHRLPMLLRFLLNILSYFHPVKISSLTTTASGSWINAMLEKEIFQDHWEHDSEIRSLRERISLWLTDANFTVLLGGFTGLAQVPIISSYNIVCQLDWKDVMAYRTLPRESNLNRVIQLGGADATFTIPSFLLPHHEHILPPISSNKDKLELRTNIIDASSKPKRIQGEYNLEQAHRDEANVTLSAHARLPAIFDQELLDCIAALVKVTKVIEMESGRSGMENEVSGLKDFTKALNKTAKGGIKKAVVSGVVNDRWIARLVGKITKKLETAHGDLGYSTGIPVVLGGYRKPYLETEGDKLLPYYILAFKELDTGSFRLILPSWRLSCHQGKIEHEKPENRTALKYGWPASSTVFFLRTLQYIKPSASGDGDPQKGYWRRSNIHKAVKEWNMEFFEPRGLLVIAKTPTPLSSTIKDLNSCPIFGETILAKTASRGDSKVVEGLLLQGADPDSSALYNAAMNKHPSVVDLLIQHGAKVDMKPSTTHLVASQGNARTLAVLLKSAFSIQRRDTTVTQLLLGHGADPNQRPWTRLEFGANASAGNSLDVAVDLSNVDAVKLLLDYSADPNLNPSGGQIPLYSAASKGDTGSMELLLKKCAEVDWSPSGFPAALYMAVAREYAKVLGFYCATERM
ncbi:hypothetical protein V491_02282 [Pseudogymnoascus sp. VKM F-3775]|nr:hypothetical protein V491_02282 [Pseudogymnoascus sp. VKM F-3775]